MLSLMMIFMSAGTTLMYCHHSHRVSIATGDSVCCHMADGNGAQSALAKSSCMDFQYVKLATLSVAQNIVIDFPNLQNAMDLSEWLMPLTDALTPEKAADAWTDTSPFPLPRAYLALIRVLVI